MTYVSYTYSVISVSRRTRDARGGDNIIVMNINDNNNNTNNIHNNNNINTILNTININNTIS